jgi:8-oxo-dGTP diphosphatase
MRASGNIWDGQDFSGTKIALLYGSRLLVYLRDQKDDIPFPGMWDLPGGGREGDESPVECVLREVFEEFGMAIAAETVTNLTKYKSATLGGPDTYFCVAALTQAEIDTIRFGEEGQRWLMMQITEFLAHDQAIAHMKLRLRAALNVDWEAQ